eukprot:TRINITY_DN7531_c0_g1_i1.p1 TRINITY_DN7531_c0_g1~~TRINITY_DN7531_c0_g1_i1.p1  ORF type:complete len:690 (+),score=102.57 TRINITY_DN7531_c0_g1_i1:1-2070(+)
MEEDPVPDIDISLSSVTDVDQYKSHEILKDLHLTSPDNIKEELESRAEAVKADLLKYYTNQFPVVVKLHGAMQGALGTLSRLEVHTEQLKKNLDAMQEEVQQLPQKTASVKHKAKNLQTIEEPLGTYLEGLVVPPSLIRCIVEGKIDESFLQHIEHLESIRKTIAGYLASGKAESMPSVNDMIPIIQMLQTKAVTRSRQFLLEKIQKISKPNTNIQILQQTLIKYSPLYSYVYHRTPSIGKQIMKYYVVSMLPIYHHYFSNYIQIMSNAMIDPVTRGDLLGATQDKVLASIQTTALPNASHTSSLPASSIARADNSASFNVFSLGRRRDIIDRKYIITSTLAKQKKFKLTEIFASLYWLLICSILGEHNFQTSMFGVYLPDKLQPLKDIPGLYLVEVSQKIPHTYDCIGLIVLLCIIEKCKKSLMSVNISSLDSHFATVTMTIARRMDELMNLHIQSINQNKSSHNLNQSGVGPHIVTRRYAEFVASVHTLINQIDSVHQSRITSKLAQLQTSIIQFLDHHAFQQQQQQTINGAVFLINNYDLIVSLLKEHDISSVDLTSFEALKKHQISSFVDVEAGKYFKDINSVLGSFTYQQTPASNDILRRIAKDFSLNWKKSLSAIQRDIMFYFSSFTLGGHLLKLIYTQVLYSYKRFIDLLEERPGVYNELGQVLVSLSVVTETVKAYQAELN